MEFLNVEKETVVVMDSNCQFLHPEKWVHGYDFKGNIDDIGLFKEMSYYWFSLADEF